MEQNKTKNNTKQNKRKTYPIRPIFHGFQVIPIHVTHVTVLDCEKRPFLRWIFGRTWYPSWHSSAPLEGLKKEGGLLEKPSVF